MSKKDDMVRRAQAATEHSQAYVAAATGKQNAGVSAPSSRPSRSVRSRPIRVSADLPPNAYRGLTDYAARLAQNLGMAKVPTVQVLRALVARLDADSELQQQIERDLQQYYLDK